MDVAADGGAALALLRDPSRAYAAVLLDQTLPDCSGRQLLAALRGERPALAGRVIFATGGLAADLADTSCPVLQKPFDIAALRALVRQVAADG